ncbi:metal-sulfur cluster assembly factor [Thermus tengchongensis]|uniref:metal-sulfur cluster assembly factor n=1 Tax=Thermus tengchongensis TaxID=1214928 RepID=UPI001F15967F|nr:metal-sulfur cluster assembly factor [Thermus tengchongensis]
MDERHREGLPEGQAGLQGGNANQAGGKEGLPTKEQVLEALKVVYDPEIPVNIVDLGLVYDVEIHENGVVDLTMTLTAIGCPAQDMVKADAEMAVMRLPGVQGVNVEFVWTPPWTPARMTEEGKRMMRMFGFNV